MSRLHHRRRGLAAGFLLADLALVLAIVALASDRPPPVEEPKPATEEQPATSSSTTTTVSTTTTQPGQLVLQQPVRICTRVDLNALRAGPTSPEALKVRDGFFDMVRLLDERGSEGFVALIFVSAPDARKSAAIEGSRVVAEMLRTYFASVFGETATRPFWDGGAEGLVYIDAYVSPGRSPDAVPADPECPIVPP